MIDNIFGITWAAPSNLIWFVPLIILVLFVIVRLLKVQQLVDKLVAVEHRDTLLKNFSLTNQRIKAVLLIGALGALGCALLRPQWDKKEEIVVNEGRDIIVALDVSRSMLAQDYQPNRLEYAKQKIKRLVKELGAERVGLLVFSGDAIMQCPLTTDYDAFFMFLDGISVETISYGTTSLGSAILKVLRAFSTFGQGRTKLVALFTDGEDFSQDLAGVKQKAIDTGVHIFTIGVGTPEGAPVPVYDAQGKEQGYQKDSKNNVVISRLNSELIQKLSQETGGKYVHVTDNDTDIMALKRWIETFEKTQFEDHQVERLQEKFYYYTGAALLLLLLEWVL